ncbi:MAG TPA: malic enzyme-like NAD(P)-binding protein [Methanothrix soehngenii]|nr:malic enzyme-like NAD(P)-binding protein [Methanothrix soehngenii]
MVDSKGVITTRRSDLNTYKREWATNLNISTLAEAVKGADLFLGLSVGNMLTSEMLSTMAPDPIVFAMANPDPEISYEEALATRDDLIFATGRSDYPNQINNLLGFPYIFRGALDVRARTINREMKLAAARALAGLAREKVPEAVLRAYGLENLEFGRAYIIPKPLDPRLISRVAPAVARAAMETGVARFHIEDWDAYALRLDSRIREHIKRISDICCLSV